MSKAATRALIIKPGTDKNGKKENIRELVFSSGSVVAVVGPTGSGKTRFLDDIERLAQSDSPTGRHISISGHTPRKIMSVTRISQTMQFFLDLTVREFIEMHALLYEKKASRIVPSVLEAANNLAGEPFSADQPLCSLSGGQARALMVADAVLISAAPILLIDEIENAGIDRQKALEFLLKKRTITFIATHDPLIALRTDVRLVFKSGGIQKVIKSNDQDERMAKRLATMDAEINEIRNGIRNGTR